MNPNLKIYISGRGGDYRNASTDNGGVSPCDCVDENGKVYKIWQPICALIAIISTFSFLAVNGMDNSKFAWSPNVVNQYQVFNASMNSTSFKPIQVCQKPKGSGDYTCTNLFEQKTEYISNTNTDTIRCKVIDNIEDVNNPIIYPNTLKVLYYDDKNTCYFEQDKYYPIQKELIIMLGCFAVISLFIFLCCCCDFYIFIIIEICYFLYCIKNIMCCCCETTSSSVHNKNDRKSTVSKSAVRKSTDSTASKSAVSTDSKSAVSTDSKSIVKSTDSKSIVKSTDNKSIVKSTEINYFIIRV